MTTKLTKSNVLLALVLGLVDGREFIVLDLQSFNASLQSLLFSSFRKVVDDILDTMTGPKLVLAVVHVTLNSVLAITIRRMINGNENVNVVRDTKTVLGVFIRKEVVKVVKSSPGDGGQTQGTRFVRSNEDAVLGFGMVLVFIKLVNAINLILC
jgi:hypothetical protein